jgi:Domain of unknown function (DUF4902)
MFDNPSREGYVRISEQALSHLQLVHLESRLDDDLLHELRAENVMRSRPVIPSGSVCTGLAQHTCQVSWDWYLERASGALLIAWGDVRSNVMCVDVQGADIGMAGTARLLARRLARLNRPRAVALAALPGAYEPNTEPRTLQ